jgi:H+/Cl- antiporter ClcA
MDGTKRTIRLVGLMLMGAFLGGGSLFPAVTHGPIESAQNNLVGAVTGTIVGLCAELFLRMIIQPDQGDQNHQD